jgi:hypothetical protein
MTPHAEPALSSHDTSTGSWSARYATTLRAQLAQAAPELDVAIESDRIGLTISGAGWAIHAVDGAPDGERYLSLMAMRGMHTGAFELAIRALCLAMDVSERQVHEISMLGE